MSVFVAGFAHASARLFFSLGLILVAAIPAAAQQKPTLELIETIVPKPYDQWHDISSGSISAGMGLTTSQHIWSAPPKKFDAKGFDLTVTAILWGIAGNEGGTVMSGDAFTVNPPERGVDFVSQPGEFATRVLKMRIKPLLNLADGSTVDLMVGAVDGPAVTYRYKVSNPGAAGDVLAAKLECESAKIVISAQSPLACQIVITSWRGNSSDPVELILPNATDGFGNHANGIQIAADDLVLATENDLPYSWSLSVFACPGKSGAASCYGSATKPGPVKVPLVVRQAGTQPVQLGLVLDASAGGASYAGLRARLGNVEFVGRFAVLDGGSAAVAPITAAMKAAMWEFEAVDGTGFVRLRSLDKPDIYLHTQAGPLEAGLIKKSWETAHWEVKSVPGTSFVTVRNRKRSDRLLYVNTAGQLRAAAVEKDRLSAKWWLMP